MKVFFDTSVLVAAVVDQLAQHERAFSCFAGLIKEGQEGVCSAHVLAECYATLTALPLARRVQPEEARTLIETNFVERLTVLPLGVDDYRDAVRRVAAVRATAMTAAMVAASTRRLGVAFLRALKMPRFLLRNSIDIRGTSVPLATLFGERWYYTWLFYSSFIIPSC